MERVRFALFLALATAYSAQGAPQPFYGQTQHHHIHQHPHHSYHLANPYYYPSYHHPYPAHPPAAVHHTYPTTSTAAPTAAPTTTTTTTTTPAPTTTTTTTPAPTTTTAAPTTSTAAPTTTSTTTTTTTQAPTTAAATAVAPATACYDCNYNPSTNGGYPQCRLETTQDYWDVTQTPCASAMCFVRLDANGFIHRGCADQSHLPFGVDKNIQCGLQAGSYFNFCMGDLCNDGQFATLCSGVTFAPTIAPPSTSTAAAALPATGCYDCNYKPGTGVGYPECRLETTQDYWDVTQTPCASAMCFVRLDANGIIYRGCADPENLPFNTDKNLQCALQSGSYWNFCMGDLCNDKQFNTLCSAVTFAPTTTTTPAPTTTTHTAAPTTTTTTTTTPAPTTTHTQAPATTTTTPAPATTHAPATATAATQAPATATQASGTTKTHYHHSHQHVHHGHGVYYQPPVYAHPGYYGHPHAHAPAHGYQQPHHPYGYGR